MDVNTEMALIKILSSMPTRRADLDILISRSHKRVDLSGSSFCSLNFYLRAL